MQRLTLINSSRIAGLVALALVVSVAACGGGDGGDDKPTSSAAVAAPAASTSTPLLAKIPSLGESYPAGLSRFVDTETGKPGRRTHADVSRPTATREHCRDHQQRQQHRTPHPIPEGTTRHFKRLVG